MFSFILAPMIILYRRKWNDWLKLALIFFYAFLPLWFFMVITEVLFFQIPISCLHSLLQSS
jgi:hypothetical protein